MVAPMRREVVRNIRFGRLVDQRSVAASSGSGSAALEFRGDGRGWRGCGTADAWSSPDASGRAPALLTASRNAIAAAILKASSDESTS
jgi:hypothetical protein